MPVTHEGLRHRQPEAEHKSSHFAGLHARLILADPKFLNPNEKSPALTPENVVSLDDRNYQPYDNVSRFERKKYWKQNAGFDENFERWKNGVTSHLNSLSTEEHDGYIPLLRNIGITIEDEDNNEYTKRHAEQIYNRYFPEKDTENSDKGIKLFIIDTIYAYTQFEKNSETGEIKGRFDSEKLNEHLPQLSEFATIFGHGSKEMIQHLLQAEIDLMTNPQKLVHASGDPAGMRINKLNDDEKNILEFIHEAQTAESRKHLPIDDFEDVIKEHIKNYDNTIVIGGTGSGKTVRTPQMIRALRQKNEPFKLIVSEPTQVNTSSIAARVAEESGVELGEEIGFWHGDGKSFNKNGKKTDTLFVTEKMLAIQLQDNPLLLDKDNQPITHVMIDEVHVQSTDTEEILALLKEVQKRRPKNMPPLKIIAASATVNKEMLEDYFDVPEAIDIKVETPHPVEKKYLDQNLTDSRSKAKKAAKIIAEIDKEEREKGPINNADVVVFVAGSADMNLYAAEIAHQNLEDTQIIKLHAGSSDRQKEEVEKAPAPGKRRIIVATNWAETGVTINGLKYVINSGEEFERTLHPETGLEYMRRIKKSRAALGQCSGRVGRVAPGTVYNLFTEADYNSPEREEYPIPQIQRSDLSGLLLDIKSKKLDIRKLEFLSSPLDEERIEFAEKTLILLGALKPDGTITEIGKRMNALPIDFHLARMIVEADKNHRGIDQLVTIAALCDGKPIIDKGFEERVIRKFGVPSSDFLSYLKIWEEFIKNDSSKEWAKEHHLNYQALMKVEKKKEKILKATKSKGSHDAKATDEELAQMITQGYKDRLMTQRTGSLYVWEREHEVDNFTMKIGKESALNINPSPQILIAGSNSTVTDESRFVYITNCQEVKPEWLPQEAA